MVDRLLKGGDFTSWVGPDNRAIGEGIGDYIVERLNGKGKVVDHPRRPGRQYDRLGAHATACSRSSRSAGIEALVAPDLGGWSADGGFKQMEDMLSKYADIDAVFCENDSMCLGAQKAIDDAGRSGEIFITSVDGEKGTLKEIMKEGTNYGATGLNSSDQIGRAGFHRAMAILAGAVRREGDRAAVADHHHGQRGEVLQSRQHVLSTTKEATRLRRVTSLSNLIDRGDRIELHDYDAAGTLQGDGASSDGTSVTIDGVSDLRDL